MSLRFRLEKIENWHETCYLADGKTMKVETEILIWATMSVDLGSITEANIEEWFLRMTFVERLFGTFGTNGDGTPWRITPEVLRRHIGLSTNVTTHTRAKWLKRQTEEFFRQQTRVLSAA